MPANYACGIKTKIKGCVCAALHYMGLRETTKGLYSSLAWGTIH